MKLWACELNFFSLSPVYHQLLSALKRKTFLFPEAIHKHLLMLQNEANGSFFFYQDLCSLNLMRWPEAEKSPTPTSTSRQLLGGYICPVVHAHQLCFCHLLNMIDPLNGARGGMLLKRAQTNKERFHIFSPFSNPLLYGQRLCPN